MKLNLAILLGLFAAASMLVSCGGDDVAVDDGYPLKVCVISGKKLGSMGSPHVHDHNGTKVKFCCEPCVKEFNKDPDKYIAWIEAGEVPAGAFDH